MSKICPPGFFCFDKNTLILIIVGFIMIVVSYISKNNDQFKELKDKIANSGKELEEKIKEVKKENHILETRDEIRSIYDRQRNYIVNKDQMRIHNPLEPPERSYPFRLSKAGIPINIATRGESPGYQQVGVLISEDGNDKKMLPLFGEPTYPGSRQWKYYTGSDGYQSVKLPVMNKNRNCQDTYGCDEIYEGNSVSVTGYGNNFKATIYKLDAPKYLPYVF